MSIERRSCVSQDPHVTKRLLAIIVLLTGLLCMFGVLTVTMPPKQALWSEDDLIAAVRAVQRGTLSYLLGRMARTEPRKSNDMLTHNLTVIADSLYKKAKRIPPKLIHQNDPDKIHNRLLNIFNCSQHCGTLSEYNLAEFVRNSVNFQVTKIMSLVNNASVYLNSLT